MSSLTNLINSAQQKLFQIETFLFILDKQLSTFTQTPGVSDTDFQCLMLEYNINFVKHKYLLEYLKTLETHFKEKLSINDSISIHISAIMLIEQQFISEISEHQNALSEITNLSLFNHDGKPENVIFGVQKFFPFDLILPFFQQNHFMTKILNLVYDENTSKDYNTLVKEVLSLLTFNKRDLHTFFVISEVIVSYFKPEIEIEKQSRIANFAFYEKCKIILKDDFSLLPIKPAEFQITTKCSPNDFSLKPFTKVIERELPFDLDGLDVNKIDIFQHVICEIQKISVCSSYSLICASILRASDFLLNTVSSIRGNLPSGADETFNILIYVICASCISNFLATFEFLDRKCPSFLKESKIGYLIEQIRSCITFINSLVLSRHSQHKNIRIVLPFLVQEGANTILLNSHKFDIVLYPNEHVPAVFQMSNTYNNKKTIAYLQEFDNDLFYPLCDVQLIDTIHGYLPLYNAEKSYPIIEDGDYEKYIASFV